MVFKSKVQQEMPANSFWSTQELQSGFLLPHSPLGSSSMADSCECAKWEKSIFLVALIQWHFFSQTLWPLLFSYLASLLILWPIWSRQHLFITSEWWYNMFSTDQSCADRTGKGVHNHLSCGTGAKQGLRRSFQKHVCITDDLLEEMPLLSHFFNQIWPALMSVQLGWLLCIQWQEKPDTPQLNMVFGELISFFSWEVIFIPVLPVQMEEGIFLHIFFKRLLYSPDALNELKVLSASFWKSDLLISHQDWIHLQQAKCL